jgi:hypothetical protein
MNCFARARSTLYTLMLGAAIALPGLQAAHLAGPPVARASSVRLPALEGYWRNLDLQTRNITRLHIYYSARDGGERGLSVRPLTLRWHGVEGDRLECACGPR